MAGIESTHKMGVDMTPSHDHVIWQVSFADEGDPANAVFGNDPYVKSFTRDAGYGVPGLPPTGPENASQGGSRKGR